MKRVYLAAAYNRATDMQHVRAALARFGIEVTSRWIDFDSWETHPTPLEGACMDLRDLVESDTAVFFTEWPSTTGGYHVEFGLAMGFAKKIIIVGPRTNLFHHLPVGERYDDLAGFLESVAA